MVKKKNEEKYVLYLFLGLVAVVFLLAFVVGRNLTGNVVHSNLDLESICENELEGQWLEQHYECIKMDRDKKDVCENYGGTYNDCGSVPSQPGECVHICKW